MNLMNSKPIIIACDHGYGNMKTAHAVFKTGVTAYDKEPTFKSNLLVYQDRYYLIGDEHKEFTAEKMNDQDYYILTLAAIVTIRTVAAEYLIAMKLRSGRQYKSDLSDILGVLAEHEKRGTPISMDQIHKAVADLYGGWESLPETSQAFIENVMEDGRFEELYEQTVSGEKEVGALLVQFEQNYPNVVTGKNVNEIAGNLQKKTDRASILAKLREKKAETDQPKTQKRDGRER